MRTETLYLIRRDAGMRIWRNFNPSYMASWQIKGIRHNLHAVCQKALPSLTQMHLIQNETAGTVVFPLNVLSTTKNLCSEEIGLEKYLAIHASIFLIPKDVNIRFYEHRIDFPLGAKAISVELNGMEVVEVSPLFPKRKKRGKG